MKKHPFETRDLLKQLTFPTLSWSSMNAFESYDKDVWFSQYVKGKRSKPNSAMQAGIDIGHRLIEDPSFLPEVPRPEIFELELQATVEDVFLRGHLDGWSPKEKHLIEYKTNSSNSWTHDRVNKHGQIDFYCLLLWLNYKINPKDIYIRLVSIPVKDIIGKYPKQLDTKRNPQVFETRRTMRDILKFIQRIVNVHRQMREYVALKGDL